MEYKIIEGADYREGVILGIDKPLGWTSSDVVRKLKYLLRKCGFPKIKIGHAGTLDPLASGVLIVCIGKATKLVNEIQAGEKEYIADVMLGATTPSGDLEHPVDQTYPTDHITPEMVAEALAGLCGERFQTPPVYSAKMIDGRRAYDYAREGEQVEMRKALVNIFEIEILELQMPLLRIRVRCSKGTYIRSLAIEIGEALGSGAHLVGLRRTRSGETRVEDCQPLADAVRALGGEWTEREGRIMGRDKREANDELRIEN